MELQQSLQTRQAKSAKEEECGCDGWQRHKKMLSQRVSVDKRQRHISDALFVSRQLFA